MVQVVHESLRADARRNRVRILDAARVEFARAGAATQMDDIARHAGVGVGTIYRHFPTKEALMGDLVRERFLAFDENARAARDGEGPAFERFAGLLETNGELMAADAGTRYAFTAAIAAVWELTVDVRRDLDDVCRPLVAEAQDDGALRPDFRVEEIGMLMCGVCASMSRVPTAGPDEWRRHLEIVLDGLRSRG